MATLTFDKLGHKYFLDGKETPSVTQIMKAAGIIDDRFYNEEGRQRGTSVHLACQYLDEGDLDWDSLDESIVPYVRAYEKFLKESEFIPSLIEHQVFWDGECPFAGTLDRSGIFNNIGLQEVPLVELIDIKTGAIPKWAGIQLAGYAIALGVMYNDVRRFGLELRKNGTYKIQQFKDIKDFDVFRAASQYFYSTKAIDEWKENHGR